MGVNCRIYEADGSEWDFRESPEDETDTYDPAGVGQWGKPKEKPKMTTVNTQEKKKLGPTDAVTPEFRASYLNAFEARSVDAADKNNPDKRNYGVEMWFRVAHTAESQRAGEKLVDIKELQAAASAAASEKWGPDQTKWPKNFKNPFKKGENNTGKQGVIPGVIIVRTNRKESFGLPVVVDQGLKPILDKNQVYSGCYMRAKVHAYAWTHPTGGAGVSFTLDMLQLVRDGEPLGNRLEAADAFEAIAFPTGGGGQQIGVAPAQTAEPAGGVFGNLG